MERSMPRRWNLFPSRLVMQTRNDRKPTVQSIHVRVGGHGPAVVMLHGFGTTGDMWGHLAGALIGDHMIIRARPPWAGPLVEGLMAAYDKKNQAADVGRRPGTPWVCVRSSW